MTFIGTLSCPSNLFALKCVPFIYIKTNVINSETITNLIPWKVLNRFELKIVGTESENMQRSETAI